MVRPQLSDQYGLLDLGSVKHPVVASIKKNFVGNDVRLSGKSPAMVVTGPNMGGKSTLLRTSALAVILA